MHAEALVDARGGALDAGGAGGGLLGAREVEQPAALAPGREALEGVAANLHKGQLVILESTTYPGTTDEVALPMLEARKLKVDDDFFLAF